MAPSSMRRRPFAAAAMSVPKRWACWRVRSVSTGMRAQASVAPRQLLKGVSVGEEMKTDEKIVPVDSLVLVAKSENTPFRLFTEEKVGFARRKVLQIRQGWALFEVRRE